MSSSTCLNCGTELKGAFCHHCGQKASTHRITFSSFVQHDLVHGVWHLDKGILYTLRTLLYSPGYAVRSFISGKRVMHYNIFALFIIIIALKTFVDAQVTPDPMFESFNQQKVDHSVNRVVDQYYKFLYLLSIPLLSLFSFLFFRRLRYNYTEHIVFNCFILTGGFFYALIISLLGWLTGIEGGELYGIIILSAYLLVGYYQATRGIYPFGGYLWRALTVFVLFLFTLALSLAGVIMVAYGGSFEGSISL